VRKVDEKYAAKINDSRIAEWAQQALKGNETPDYARQDSPLDENLVEETDKLLSKLLWLMFGTETERSPSAYANSMMVLKLIAIGDMTWKEAFSGRKFGGGLFNMSMENAVPVARTSEILTGTGSGVDYYQGPVSNAKTLKEELEEFFSRQEEVAERYVSYKIRRNPKKYLTPKPLDVVRRRTRRLYRYRYSPY
jgi:hypothetical protein